MANCRRGCVNGQSVSVKESRILRKYEDLACEQRKHEDYSESFGTLGNE